MANNGKTEKKRGRPATGRDPSVTIRLPAALIEWIDREAVRKEIGRSEMVRRLITMPARGRSLKAKRLGSTGEDGGSIPARPLQIIAVDEASEILEGTHYLGPVQYMPRFCIATTERDAIAVYSPPVASHFKKIDGFMPLELARLWQAEGVERPLSKFLAASLRWLRKLDPSTDCVFSYADPARKHRGTIYRAANFSYLGQSRATDYWQTPEGDMVSSPVCYRMFKTKSRIKIQAINPKWKLVVGEPKLLYVYGLRRSSDEVRVLIKGRYA